MNQRSAELTLKDKNTETKTSKEKHLEVNYRKLRISKRKHFGGELYRVR